MRLGCNFCRVQCVTISLHFIYTPSSSLFAHTSSVVATRVLMLTLRSRSRLSFSVCQSNKKGEEYSEGRTAADFVKFFNEKSGTERILGGGLLESAGRIPALDKLAQEFIQLNPTQHVRADQIYEEAERSLSKDIDSHPNHKDYAPFYTMVMKHMKAGKKDYAAKEWARLKKISESSHLTPKSLSTFHKRMNIMKQFMQPSELVQTDAAADEKDL